MALYECTICNGEPYLCPRDQASNMEGKATINRSGEIFINENSIGVCPFMFKHKPTDMWYHDFRTVQLMLEGVPFERAVDMLPKMLSSDKTRRVLAVLYPDQYKR